MSRLFEELLAARGVGRDFLAPSYDECLDPELLPDMPAAVERIKQARDREEKVLIYGDYDVDGVTASTVMWRALKFADIKGVEVMLPNRFTDGYGMSEKVVARAVDTGVRLVITVDCGSRNLDIVEKLSAAGIDTIVTDHHECGDALPKAVAVLNPKRTDTAVPAELRDLAGVGVAFKVAQALTRAGLIPAGREKWLLDLVLIGTLCDSMKMSAENRRLCFYGLKVLAKTRWPGLKELMRVAGTKRLNGDAIGFQLGPRLNAAGRMDTAEKSLQLLLTENRPEAAKLALELEQLNAERKSQQRAAVEAIKKTGVGDDPVIVVDGEWHEGVIGIIAGRLVEEFRRPAFVFSRETADCLKGSGRSFGDFNLAKALASCEKVIIGGGGHAEACGVKVTPDNLPVFRERVNDYYRSLNLQDQARFLAAREDLAVRHLDDLSLELVAELLELEPFGAGNAEPVFLLPEVRVAEVARLGSSGEHLRLVVEDEHGGSLKLMQFFAPAENLRIQPGGHANFWVTLSENEFRGIRSVEGRILRIES